MPEQAKTPIFRFEGVNVHYGAIQALHDVSFEVEQGQIVSLIGGNGAGKTTTLRAISGLVKLTKGKITYNGHTISGLPAHEIVKKT